MSTESSYLYSGDCDSFSDTPEERSPRVSTYPASLEWKPHSLQEILTDERRHSKVRGCSITEVRRKTEAVTANNCPGGRNPTSLTIMSHFSLYPVFEQETCQKCGLTQTTPPPTPDLFTAPNDLRFKQGMTNLCIIQSNTVQLCNYVRGKERKLSHHREHM
ncbi:hypothetical protein RRG08_026824 [Elysia crispata]|uniref:Uncharacterized protein n=1 Tax=Elysia crispata TaxID=231223 RepID=A0AAE0ZH70_9GAST|nr:hypothetical protein RRG08_026824 [Elysia crispata]